ncbi:MAG: hypothetical protein RLZZ31_1448 [Actinomycetota bacterium]
MSAPVFQPTELRQWLSDGFHDAIGVLYDQPVIVVNLDDPAQDFELPRLAALLSTVPILVVGFAAQSRDVSLDVFDTLLCLEGEHRHWVGVAGIEPFIDSILAAPRAAVAVGQLLRVSERSSVSDAVVAESLAYSLLQSGTDYQSWLSKQSERKRHPAPNNSIVDVQRDDDVLSITLNRPEVRNAYGRQMRDELVEAFRLVDSDPTLKKAVVRGNGPTFCSGGDLDEFGSAPPPLDAHFVRTTRNAGIVLSRNSARIHFEVHGRCVGAGVELPAFSQNVIADSETTFRLPEVAMGLVPGAGGTASIPRRIGRWRALWLMVSGEEIDCERALKWGLVDQRR